MKKNNRLDIIYEDKHILVVNKPAGLLTIATEKEKEKTLFHQVYLYEKKKNKNNLIFIVHRLDKDTSGIVLFAKSTEIKEYFQSNWENVAKLKEYVAVVEGRVVKKSDRIESYLKENKILKSYSTYDKTGKLAITEYELINSSKSYSLLKVKILTGRKNQIRVHLSDINHPIIGDKKYGAKTNPLRRIGLHASKLIIEHPITKEIIEFESKTPDMMLKMFKGERNEKEKE